ncbi:MAG: signal peptidase I [Acholeplasmataceae bacterium]|nr:signal peptidase I [Acholeplasmataceae bacterium]
MGKIIKKIIAALSILVFIFAIYVMFAGTNAARNGELLWIFNHAYSVVPTGSMIGDEEDSIDPGDIIFFQKIAYEDIDIGDVIVFQDPEKPILVVHRVVEEDENGYFITRGDNNPSDDTEPVTPTSFRGGKVVFVSGFLSLGTAVINYRNIIFLLIVLLLIGILVSELIKIIKHVKDEDIRKTQESLDKANEEALNIERERLKDELRKEMEKNDFESSQSN